MKTTAQIRSLILPTRLRAQSSRPSAEPLSSAAVGARSNPRRQGVSCANLCRPMPVFRISMPCVAFGACFPRKPVRAARPRSNRPGGRLLRRADRELKRADVRRFSSRSPPSGCRCTTSGCFRTLQSPYFRPRRCAARRYLFKYNRERVPVGLLTRQEVYFSQARGGMYAGRRTTPDAVSCRAFSFLQFGRGRHRVRPP